MPDLFATIDAAFAYVEYPGDDQLTIGRKEGREFDETWKLLEGKDWREMPVREFMAGDTPIPDLTPLAWHYYLPALLKASLAEDLSDEVLDSLAFYLNPKNARSDDPKFGYDWIAEHEQFRLLLSQRQLKAVTATIDAWYAREWLEDDQYAELLNAYKGSFDQ